MKLNCNLPFICPDNIKPHLEKVFEGEYEVPLFRYAPFILDLGANCGAFSVWASHRWPGSRIWAYEPHPDNFTYLARNTKDYPNVTAFNWAIGTPGLRVLNDGRFNGGEASFHSVVNNLVPATGRHIEVKDPLTLPEANILKMDIEGCEVEVLRSLIEAGRRFDAVLVEYHNDQLRREIDSLLSGYKIVRAEAHPSGMRGTLCYLNQGD